MKLQNIRQKQDEERRKLHEIRTLLSNTPNLNRYEVILFAFYFIFSVYENATTEMTLFHKFSILFISNCRI